MQAFDCICVAGKAPADALGSSLETPSLEALLEEGICRLSEKGTWKKWLWPPEGESFYTTESFRYNVSVFLWSIGWFGHFMCSPGNYSPWERQEFYIHGWISAP